MINICKLIDRNKKYYIYGIAYIAKFAYDRIAGEFGDDLIVGFIQTVPNTGSYCGKNVYNVHQAIDYADESTMFILASKNKSDEMKKNLTDCGIAENMIISLKDYWFVGNSIAGKQIQSVFLWPALNKMNADLVDKIKWFLPDRIKVRICSSNNDVISAFSGVENIDFVDQKDTEEILKYSDYIYVWDADQISNNLTDYMNKVIVIDPNFYYHKDIAIYGNTYFHSFSESEKKEFVEHSKNVMKKMQNEFSGKKRANVFCTGPSIEEIFDVDFSQDINIVCNSMIKDRDLMEMLKPNILVFGDVAFYLSPNRYCQAFYRDLLYTFEKYQCYIIVYDYEVPLLRYHFPILYDRLIGIRFDDTDQYHFPNDIDLYVKVTRNICTLFMLPIASAICHEIGIAGCTGRSADETYFWKHNGKTQYLDLMQYVFEAYPAFFKYSDYEDYYDKHCQCINDLIEYGEKNGKKYINLTTSFIPALKQRTVGGKK